VRGFRRARFSGLTTPVFAALVADLMARRPGLDGLLHVSAEPIDKHTLLGLLRDALGLDVEIVPDDSVVIDRTLDSSRFRALTGWTPPAWGAMVGGLAVGEPGRAGAQR
jgi:dTDP-4-dehydrorhamnose reductase